MSKCTFAIPGVPTIIPPVPPLNLPNMAPALPIPTVGGIPRLRAAVIALALAIPPVTSVGLPSMALGLPMPVVGGLPRLNAAVPSLAVLVPPVPIPGFPAMPSPPVAVCPLDKPYE
jgi:hypothetical protein